ncbi:hypothetical protein F2Q69_00005701 [Brassica cretica]|uniref:RING-CH-type domain-containing protein n=1 Tax=Brassica cretica TaxID=69181 RepID=A0A8S9NXD3_BRACR|nr:hypothetical protein F2Q69_00005701 [Brassica cretica]
MSDRLSLCTDRLITAEKLESEKDSDSPGETSRPQGADLASSSEGVDAVEEEEPLLQSVECRICQEEDTIQNLEAPCACNGSLKYAHRKCVQRWCNEKGDITCEICHQINNVLSLVLSLSMSDRLSLCTDRLITAEKLESEKDSDSPGETSRPQGADLASSSEGVDAVEEEEPLLQSVECRICQEEDTIQNLEAPCACNGSLKYAHRKCVQRWCNEKGDITCEICHQAYQPGYTAPPPPPPPPDETIIHIGDPRILAMAAAERHFLEADYDEYSESNSSGVAFWRSATLILMALLLLRDALNLTTNPDDEDDPTAFFSLFLLRAAGFLLPCYIMAWASEAALAAAEVAFMIHGGVPQRRGLHFVVAPEQPPIPNQTPV